MGLAYLPTLTPKTITPMYVNMPIPWSAWAVEGWLRQTDPPFPFVR